jgi:hypothetical protein
MSEEMSGRNKKEEMTKEKGGWPSNTPNKD